MEKLRTDAPLFLLGALGYPAIEILWRGYTHPTMALAGGISAVLLYRINRGLAGGALPLRLLASGPAVTLIEPGDYAGFARLIENRRGRRIAVISRCRDGVGQELDFLRRCAKKYRLELDVSKPDIMEKLPPFGERDRRNALFLIRVPEGIPLKNEKPTVKGK